MTTKTMYRVVFKYEDSAYEIYADSLDEVAEYKKDKSFAYVETVEVPDWS